MLPLSHWTSLFERRSSTNRCSREIQRRNSNWISYFLSFQINTTDTLQKILFDRIQSETPLDDMIDLRNVSWQTRVDWCSVAPHQWCSIMIDQMTMTSSHWPIEKYFDLIRSIMVNWTWQREDNTPFQNGLATENITLDKSLINFSAREVKGRIFTDSWIWPQRKQSFSFLLLSTDSVGSNYRPIPSHLFDCLPFIS